MKIIVCIKPVPSSNEVRLDPQNGTIIREGRESVINPFDEGALEQAIKLKETLGGEIVTVSMGIPDTARLLKDTLARGADQAFLFSDRRFAGADTLATAYTLSLGIKRLGDFDLIICGKMSIDGDTAQIGPELAQMLGIAYCCNISEVVDVGTTHIQCRRITDGRTQLVRLPLPALVTVGKRYDMLRFPSISGVRQSLAIPVENRNALDLQTDLDRIGLNGSPTRVIRTFVPQRAHGSTEIVGDANKQAEDICRIVDGVR